MGQPQTGTVADFQTDSFLVQLRLQLHQKLVNNRLDDIQRQRYELYNGVQPVTKLWGKGPLNGLAAIGAVIQLSKANGRTAHGVRTGVGGHDQNHIADVRLTTIVVRQSTVDQNQAHTE